MKDHTDNKTSVILFGSLGVAVDCLEWLMSQPSFEIKGVVCSKAPMTKWREAVGDRDMLPAATQYGIPILTMEDVLTIQADLGLSVRFHQILKQSHLDRFSMGVINLHGAPLPEMRGSMTDAMAIIENRDYYGTSLHWMDTGIDSGNILAVERFPITSEDTVYDLFVRSNRIGLELIQTKLNAIIRGDIHGESQEMLLSSTGRTSKTYTKKEVMAWKRVVPETREEQLWRVVRAFQFPGQEPAYIETREGRIYLSAGSNNKGLGEMSLSEG
ncbi:formyltransferase family protein [Paenibacillus hemerocallicola]|nr:formyltransferase family protein [Paenibacillus hemerocallicola]